MHATEAVRNVRKHKERLKLLLIAPSCSRDDVGEAWSSFQWVSRISERHDVTLLTSHKTCRPPVASQLSAARVVEWPDLSLFERWERFNSRLKPSYIPFYMHARRWLRDRLRSGEKFDLVHQISPLALRYPSPAAGFPVTLVIGPLGGSIRDPENFRAELRKGPWYTKLRSIDRWRLRHDPWLRSSYTHAERIICVAPYVRELLEDLPRREVEYMSETGVTQLPPPSSLRESNGSLRLLFVGRVVRSKGARDAIRALALVKELEGISLDVVGDGDDLDACKEEARLLGLRNTIAFHGRLPRNEIDAFYARAHVFLFPSFREPSGNAVLEAMSHGLPLIVANRGGPGFAVDDSCGFRVPVVNPQQLAVDIANCIRKFALERNLVSTMGCAARSRIKGQFLWEAKVDRMVDLYRNIIASCECQHALAA